MFSFTPEPSYRHHRSPNFRHPPFSHFARHKSAPISLPLIKQDCFASGIRVIFRQQLSQDWNNSFAIVYPFHCVGYTEYISPHIGHPLTPTFFPVTKKLALFSSVLRRSGNKSDAIWPFDGMDLQHLMRVSV